MFLSFLFCCFSAEYAALWLITLSSTSLLLLSSPVTSVTDGELPDVLTVVADLSVLPSTSDAVLLIALEALLIGHMHIRLCCHLDEVMFAIIKFPSSAPSWIRPSE